MELIPEADDVANGSAGLEARRFASRLLKSVLHRRQPFDESFAALAAQQPYAALSARDRAFARAIAMVSLRRLGQLDDLIARFLKKPLPDEASDVRLTLLIGAAQLAFLGVAPHAAISLAVDQAKTQRAGRFSSLVNAVLRRVSENYAAIIAEQDEARLNTPAWLFERWRRHYGEEAARNIARAHLEEPPLDLSIKDDPAIWAEKLSGHLLPSATVRLAHKGRIEEIEGYHEGAWWVQDAAAALPALLLGDVGGKRVADLCAAPGGKTAQLAAAGAHVTAVDISVGRLRRLKENLTRLRLDAEIVQADVSAWSSPEPFDTVLLDAPCSSTGTIRRNPDIALLKSEGDVAALSSIQERLLDHAARLVKPGGTFIYCTCSLEPEEGEQQIERFLGSRADFRRSPVLAGESGIPGDWLTAKGELKTLPNYLQIGPGLHGMDGFYAARLVRDSSP